MSNKSEKDSRLWLYLVISLHKNGLSEKVISTVYGLETHNFQK